MIGVHCNKSLIERKTLIWETGKQKLWWLLLFEGTWIDVLFYINGLSFSG